MDSIASWQARHTPAFAVKAHEMHAKSKLAHEMADRQFEALRYQMEMQNQQSQVRENAVVSVEQIRGHNSLAEIHANLDAKISLLGAEAQISAFLRLTDEQTKNRDFFRSSLEKQAEFRAVGKMAVIQALIAKKTGVVSHGQNMELEKLKIETANRKAEIDELTKKSIAWAELEAKKNGEASAIKGMEEIIEGWERACR